MNDQAGSEQVHIVEARQALTRCGLPVRPWVNSSHSPDTVYSQDGEPIAVVYDPALMRSVMALPGILEASLLALASLNAFAAIAKSIEAGSEAVLMEHTARLEMALRRAGVASRAVRHG